MRSNGGKRNSLTLPLDKQLASCLTATPNSAFIVGYAGTSQAAPHVSGLMAKLVEKYGKNNPQQLKQALTKTGVDDLGPRGKDPAYGAGRINVAKALGL